MIGDRYTFPAVKNKTMTVFAYPFDGLDREAAKIAITQELL